MYDKLNEIIKLIKKNDKTIDKIIVEDMDTEISVNITYDNSYLISLSIHDAKKEKIDLGTFSTYLEFHDALSEENFNQLYFFEITRKGIMYYHKEIIINDWINSYLENHSTPEEWTKSEELLSSNNEFDIFWMEIAEKAARKYHTQYL